MKTKIKEYATASPFSAAVEIALIAVLLFSLPNLTKTGETATLVLHVVFRTAAVVLSVLISVSCGFKFFAKVRVSISETCILCLGFLVCINNFPFICLTSGNVIIGENANVFYYILYCAFIGISEEFVFRGVILPLVAIKFKNRARAPFLTVALNSLIFSLCHAFNVFSIGVGMTAMQVGYTFLTGGLFGIAYLITENIVFPIILHVIFDIGGLMFSQPFGIAAGNMWDLTTIIITAVLGVFATAVFFVKIYNFRLKSTEGQK